MTLFKALFALSSLSTCIIHAAPSLVSRESVSTLTSAQISAFKPYTFYAGSGHCAPEHTLAWDCGKSRSINDLSLSSIKIGSCKNNPTFKPVAAGGDGNKVQFWYVGYDPTLEGTDFSKILPVITDLDFFLDELDSSLFPGISTSIQVHDGFGAAQARSAKDVLAGVETAISTYDATKVTIVGHSLGGAIALITSVYLPLHLPKSTSFRTITYGMPRVGNRAFADYVDANLHVTHINNQDDIVPILPGRFLGFHHPAGEFHIVNSGAWINCPGQDNTDSQCTIGYVPNIFAGDTGDHSGPYDGVKISC